MFKLKENNTTAKQEVIAGITTFMTMAYILAVNPNLLSQAGMDPTAVLIATCLASFIGTFAMALLANLSVCTCTGYGTECILCIYRSSWHGLFLADRYDSDVCGGGDLYPDYVSERPGGDLE